MRISDFFKPKHKHSSYKKRIAAIKNIADDDILFDIVQNDSNIDVRIAAVKKFYDEKKLYDVISEGNFESIVDIALDNISNQELRNAAIIIGNDFNIKTLIYVSLNDKDEATRISALKKIPSNTKMPNSETEMLFEFIALNDKSAAVKEYVNNYRSREVKKTITKERKLSLIDIWLLPSGGPEFIPMNVEGMQISVTMPVDVPLEEVHQWHIDELGRDHLQIHEIKHRGYHFWVQIGSKLTPPRQGIIDFFHCVELSSSLARCERFELIVPQSHWGKDRPLVEKAHTYRMNALIDGDKTESSQTKSIEKDSTIDETNSSILGDKYDDKILHLSHLMALNNNEDFVSGLKSAVELADSSDIRGVYAIEEAIRKRAGQPSISFYSPRLRLKTGSGLISSVETILHMAKKNEILKDVEKTGACIVNIVELYGQERIAPLASEVAQLGDTNQGYAILLIYNQIVNRTKIHKSANAEKVLLSPKEPNSVPVAVIANEQSSRLLDTIRPFFSCSVDFLASVRKEDLRAVIIVVDCKDKDIAHTYKPLKDLSNDGVPVLAGLILNNVDEEMTVLVDMEMRENLNYFGYDGDDTPIFEIEKDEDLKYLQELVVDYEKKGLLNLAKQSDSKTDDKFSNDKSVIEKPWTEKELEELDSFETIRPDGSGLCSDNGCPCDETVIPRGEGYIYISESCANFRKEYRTAINCEEKLNELSDHFAKKGQIYMPPNETWSAILMCNEGAKRRNLDLKVSSKDAQLWWKEGRTPCRATPETGAVIQLRNSNVVVEYPSERTHAGVSSLGEVPAGERIKLLKVYSSWSDEKLINATTLENNDYTDDAIIVMRHVIEQRGITISEVKRVQENLTQQKKIDRKAAALKKRKFFKNLFLVFITTILGLACLMFLIISRN